MASFEFILRSKPFSINAAFYSDARTKTREVKDWAHNIFYQLNSPEHVENLKAARDMFDEDKHSIEIEIIAYYPRSIFITKEGKLSARTFDISNCEKLLIDLFFDKQYYGQPSPYGAPNLNLNDKHITKMMSSKFPHSSDEHSLVFRLRYVDRPF